MSHVTLQDAKTWLELNGNGVSSNERDGVALSSIQAVLEGYPAVTFAEIKRLSNTDSRALTSSGAAGALRFQAWARDMLSQYGADNNTLTFFIDRGGNLPFNGASNGAGAFGTQRTLTPGEDIVGFIRQTMADYEALTGGTIRFEEVNEDDLATISFYYSKEYLDSRGLPICGMSINATNGIGGKWRNVFYNSCGKDGLAGLHEIKNTIVHEMGHTIGFSHPTDLATDLTGNGIGSGFNTIYDYVDSIMSYNTKNPSGYTLYDLTGSDENAYRHLWQSFSGSEDLASSSGKSLHKANGFGQATTANGGKPSGLASLKNQSRDYITGSSRDDWYVGDQSDDTWHGGEGNDNYFYKGGFDFASGEGGKDTFHIDPLNADGYLTINDFTAGQDKLVFQSDADYSIFAFGGATFVLASDTDKVVFLQGEFTEQQLLGDASASLPVFRSIPGS